MLFEDGVDCYREFHRKLEFIVFFYCSNREGIILHEPPVSVVI